MIQLNSMALMGMFEIEKNEETLYKNENKKFPSSIEENNRTVWGKK